MPKHECKTNLDLFDQWIFKAKQDLRAVKKLMIDDDLLIDIAIYHAQQSGEKALKAFLALQMAPIQKTHDLEKLIHLCLEFDNDFEAILTEAATLTPYGTRFRYPDDLVLPDKKDVVQAIAYAEKILKFVEKKARVLSNRTLKIF